MAPAELLDPALSPLPSRCPASRPARGRGARARLLALLVPALAAAAGCTSSGDGSSRTPRAERIAVASQIVSGDGATSRVGDVLLANAAIRAVVQDLTPSRWLLDMKGGGLTDIDIVRASDERGGDFLKQLVPSVLHVSAIPFGASANVQEPRTLEIVEDGGSAGRALVRVLSGTDIFGWIPPFVPQGVDVQLDLTTDYVLDGDSPYLRIETTVRNAGRALGNSSLPGDIFLLAGEHKEFTPGRGFDFPGYAFRVDYLASVTPGASLLFFGSEGPFSIVADASGFVIALQQAMDLPAGGEAKFERYVVPGNGDLASVQVVYWRLRGIATGALAGTLTEEDGTAAGGVLVSIYPDGSGEGEDALFSTALTDSRGRFAAELPPGRYLARVEDSGRATQTGVPFEIAAGAGTEIALAAPAAGALSLRVTDGSGRILPSRVRADGPAGKTILVTDRDVVEPLRPGHYTVTASRGFEWTRQTLEVDVPAGGTAQAAFTLTRPVDTTGWVAAELHLHTNRSSDSSTLVSRQVAAIAGMGIEYALATDHDNLTDYTPVIESLGLTGWMRSGVGDEISTTFYGHFQGIPLTMDPNAAANGAVSWLWKSPEDLFAAIRADPSNRLIQVNHPNAGLLGGYFEAIGYDNATGEATRPPEALGFPSGTEIAVYDFDAFEAMNGASIDDGDNRKAFETYVSLTNFGRRYAMTGNSDSHSVGTPAGYPRNLVRVSTDDPARLDEDEIFDSIAARKVVVSGGLFLTMTVDGGEIGSDVTDTDGVVDVGFRLQAPPWMDADRVTLYGNGAIVHEIDVAPSQQAVRYEGTIQVAIDRDTWFLATARGDASMAPVVNDIPYAVTNPIWVDRDGNGRFDPPGAGSLAVRQPARERAAASENGPR